MALISRCRWLFKLEELLLYGNTGLTSEGIAFLSESPHLRHLRLLDLHASSVDDEGLQRLFRSEVSAQLKHLNLGMNWARITNQTLKTLRHSQHCTGLLTLNLEDCQVGDIGMS